MRKPAPSKMSVPVTRSTARFYKTFLFLFDVREGGVEAVPAARLVEPARANQHAFAARDQPLGMVRGIAANHADRECLRDVFGDGQQLRHRLERPPEVILVQTGNDDPLAVVGERVTG